MMEISLNMYHAVALGAVLFWIGGVITDKVSVLNRYCIPAPLVGGLLFSIINCILTVSGVASITFDGTLQTVFQNLFFTTVGFTVSIPALLRGGKSVVLVLILSIIMIPIQNALGGGIMLAFGQDPLIGIGIGSTALIGGPATAAAFGPDLVEAGAVGADVAALAAATFGLVSGSLMGGPLGRWKIKKYNLKPLVTEESADLGEPETVYQTKSEMLSSDTFLSAFVLIIIATGLGTYVTNAFAAINITLPVYIGGMLVALVIRNIADLMGKELPLKAIDVAGNTSLNVFLGIALMTLMLWQLAALAVPIVVILAVQTVVMYLYASFVVFRAMGKDYEAAVMTAAICGFGMGATPNAMANMLAIKNQYGPAPKAFFVVPLVGGMFIDFTNSAIITVFTNLLS